MKRLFSALTGLALVASASGCCCDGCNWCNPCCRPCGGGCAPTYGGPPATGYLSPYGAPAVSLSTPVTTTTAMPATYFGAPVATAAVVPVESLPTY
ncbi:MAG: hypothetical protein ACM3U2_10220 [Deltaproteobacteria bacterium]